LSLKLAESYREVPSSYITKRPEREEAAMPSCPECENELDVELDELEEGDVVACDECGTEYEVVGVEPLELTRVDDGYDDEEDEPFEEEEEEE
jgi:alpha-aminoadipate/glutamate carrier protein LysW